MKTNILLGIQKSVLAGLIINKLGVVSVRRPSYGREKGYKKKPKATAGATPPILP